MNLKSGARLVCPASTVEVIVVKPPSAPVSLTCGGIELVPPEDRSGVFEAISGDGPLVGKRYADDESGLELLCTKAGAGTLACNGRELPIKQPKPLPASD